MSSASHIRGGHCDTAAPSKSRLGRYIDISRGARRKFAIGPSRTATYIDLFSGAGRARARGTSRIIDGSPLVAYRAAVASGQAFTEIHLAHADPALRLAAATRIVAAGGSAVVHAGSAEDVVAGMVGQLNPHGLHFAFLDPFNLGALSLSVVSELARLERMDMLVHVSAMDLRKNVRQNLEANADSFDRFAPGWRDAVGEDGNDRMPVRGSCCVRPDLGTGAVYVVSEGPEDSPPKTMI